MDQFIEMRRSNGLAAKADHKGAFPMGMEVRPDLSKPVDEGLVLKKICVSHLSDKKPTAPGWERSAAYNNAVCTSKHLELESQTRIHGIMAEIAKALDALIIDKARSALGELCRDPNPEVEVVAVRVIDGE